MPGLNKTYNYDMLKQIKSHQFAGSTLLLNDLKTEAIQYYARMLNCVYGCGGNYIQGKQYLSQIGLNVEAQEFIPSLRGGNNNNIEVIGHGSNIQFD
ncbi:hypothetical protein [Rickettsia sp. TH2014]|uniref:hypothetical protein n=1 Tax=Rickettsia sp. TH2014 TaxID=1967503 RepID=UPI001C47D021|nr:hypothetical protein [Rickettsia sp. TH2014]